MASNLLHLKIIGKGPPLILLHGWGWHSGIFSPLIPHLCNHFELLIPDLPGYGKSPPLSDNNSFDAIASVLLAVLPQDATWLGWSLGGMLAWWVALHEPRRIKRLITVCSSPRFTSDANWPGMPLPQLETFGKDLTDNPEKTGLEFLRLQLLGQPRLFAQLQSQLLPSDMKALQGGLDILKKTDFRSQLHGINIPSLHIFGGLDTLVPVEIVNHLQPLLSPHAQTAIIPRAGHIPFLSHLSTFLQRTNLSQ